MPHGVREYDHPLAGRLPLIQEILRVPGNLGHQLMFLGGAPGTDTAERLLPLDRLEPGVRRVTQPKRPLT